MADAEELLAFWFGPMDGDGICVEDRSELWWSGRPDDDRALRERFGKDAEEAAAGRREGWAATPRGRLALILLLDQLPRSLHRGRPEAFACDAHARAHTMAALTARQDRELGLSERVFLYLPLEHAEDLALQQRSVRLYRKLLDDVPPRAKGDFQIFLDEAERHRDAIARFGRFPHRNAALGREPTPDELLWLSGRNDDEV